MSFLLDGVGQNATNKMKNNDGFNSNLPIGIDEDDVVANGKWSIPDRKNL